MAALALLALLGCALSAATYRYFGNFWDEPEHLAAGVDLIQRGEYRYDNQHPPLARLAAAIGPYLAGARIHGDPNPVGEAQGRELLYHSPPASYQELLSLARFGVLPFLLLLAVATWCWMRRWQGDATALLSVAFLISSPVILGHAAVVALDVPVTALTVASLYLLLRWFELPSLTRAAAFGVATGLAVATKMSAVPFIGISMLSLLALRLGWLQRRPLAPGGLQLRRRGGGALLALVLVLAIIIGVYGDTLVYLTTPDLAPSKSLDFIAGSAGPLHDLAYRLAARTPLPLGLQMVPLNFLGVEWHNENGHLSYLLGQVAIRGWWYFYLVALSVKTTLPLLLLGLAGLTLMGVRALRAGDLYLAAPAVCFAAILVFCCLYSHINIGVRHVLIAYPLLAMGAAYALHAAWQRWPRWPPRALLGALLLWQIATPLYAFPDYVAYFNLLAGAHPERILVDSDLDWGGQDLKRLERVLAERHVDRLWLGYKGTADLSLEPLPAFTPLKPGQPVKGWIAITPLTMQENLAGYGWLRQYRPLQRVGGSFELYYIP